MIFVFPKNTSPPKSKPPYANAPQIDVKRTNTLTTSVLPIEINVNDSEILIKKYKNGISAPICYKKVKF
jgi:hypothetical protein